MIFSIKKVEINLLKILKEGDSLVKNEIRVEIVMKANKKEMDIHIE
jgi:hypothetical protein